MSYNYTNVRASIEKNSQKAASNNSKLTAHISLIQQTWANGKKIRSSQYDPTLDDLNGAKANANAIFEQYGEETSPLNFATPAIDNGEDTSNEKNCCTATQSVIDLKEALDKIYSDVREKTYSTLAGFLGTSLNELIGYYNTCIELGTNVIEEGNKIVSEIDSLDKDTLLDDENSEGDLDEKIANYFALCASYVQWLGYKSQYVSEAKQAVDSDNESFSQEHEEAIDIHTIIDDHKDCHNDEVTLSFYTDPKTYTDDCQSNDENPTKIDVYKGYSMQDCGQTAPSAKEVGEFVTFDEWVDLNVTDEITEDKNVYGKWNVNPQIILEIDDEETQTYDDLGQYNMFADVKDNADDYVDDKVNDMSEDDEDTEYKILKYPSNYTLDAENYKLTYEIKKEIGQEPITHRVRELVRTKTGNDTYSEYVVDKTEEVNDGSSYYLIKDLDRLWANDKEEYINYETKIKTIRDSENPYTTDSITEDCDFKFTKINLFDVTYKDRHGNSCRLFGDERNMVEEYSVFNVEENESKLFFWPSSDGKWPLEEFYIENDKEYKLCEKPDRYRIEGGPINSVTSDIEVFPRYTEVSNEISVTVNLVLYGRQKEFNQYDWGGAPYGILTSMTYTYETSAAKYKD